jgi:hypothetical protein
MFRDFAKAAFTGYTGSGLFGIGLFVEMLHESKYVTAGLEEVLKETFGEGRIFGETQDDDPASAKFRNMKVGVTLTSSSGHPFYVANYTRPMEIIENEQDNSRTVAPGYEFFRAETKDTEMKTWEAYISHPLRFFTFLIIIKVYPEHAPRRLLQGISKHLNTNRLVDFSAMAHLHSTILLTSRTPRQVICGLNTNNVLTSSFLLEPGLENPSEGRFWKAETPMAGTDLPEGRLNISKDSKLLSLSRSSLA